MRPLWYFRKFISHTRPVDIPINFFVPEHLEDLETCRMVVAEWLDVINVICKDDIGFALVQFFD